MNHRLSKLHTCKHHQHVSGCCKVTAEQHRHSQLPQIAHVLQSRLTFDPEKQTVKLTHILQDLTLSVH